MDKDERLRLRTQAQKLAVAMSVGKAGLTEGVVEEVRRQLEEQRLLKLRLLPSAREEHDRGDLAAELAERTGAELVEVRGNTVVLWRGRGGRRRTASGAGSQARGSPR